eukprot:CAMPEP_0204080238 /NCGR_PEP_ID=MMETSP0360-20130528/173677_1 /ASSEMBLY_ACC=CAM_ASM_000342 /TAXON_ID=268821 /ORGANISM="Scrippsiella Hangoei, Strain SHTV-5" /LENGTH=60 /DNA_ID=CAMNT_0051029011 /DNA_START=26 /DNA_END=206 /DNA_ORIENTATION=+
MTSTPVAEGNGAPEGKIRWLPKTPALYFGAMNEDPGQAKDPGEATVGSEIPELLITTNWA